MRAPESCPVCGADVPRRARACPECGADETTGWSEDAQSQSLDLPDDNFDYDEFVKREFEGKPARRKSHWLWWSTAILLLVLFVVLFLIR
jgi:uncharacterized membrane protein YvbJ